MTRAEKTSRKPPIRALLRSSPNGLTVAQIANALGIENVSIVRTALRAMPDSYISGWDTTPRKYAAIWSVVVPPPNAPRPVPEEILYQRLRNKYEVKK